MMARAEKNSFNLLRTNVCELPLELLHASYRTHAFARHWNETYVLQLVEQGVNEFYCRGKIYHAPAGSIVLINPHDIHTGCALGDEPLAYRTLYPTAELFEKLETQFSDASEGAPIFPQPVVQDAALAALFRETFQALERKASPFTRTTLLLELLTLLRRRHSARRTARAVVYKEPSKIKLVEEYLRANLQHNISLAELAQISQLSLFHLSRIFRQTLGLPPHEYLSNLRIARAKQLLGAGLSIPQAARATGFYDQSHFNKKFKRIVGLTPGQYLQWRSSPV